MKSPLVSLINFSEFLNNLAFPSILTRCYGHFALVLSNKRQNYDSNKKKLHYRVVVHSFFPLVVALSPQSQNIHRHRDSDITKKSGIFFVAGILSLFRQLKKFSASLTASSHQNTLLTLFFLLSVHPTIFHLDLILNFSFSAVTLFMIGEL